MKCDFKIYGVPQRLHMILRLAEKLCLSNDDIIIDYELGGSALDTFMKAAMSEIPNGVTHRVIFQDDVDVCYNFKEQADFLAGKYPNKIFSFFIGDSKKRLYRNRSGIIVRTGGGMYGQCILFPLGILDEMKSLYEKVKGFKHDVIFMQTIARMLHIDVYTTVPCLVDHLCRTKNESVMGHTWGCTTDYKFDSNADVRLYTEELKTSLCQPMSKGLYKWCEEKHIAL